MDKQDRSGQMRYYTDKQVSLRLSARNRGYTVYSKDSDKRMTICYDYKTNRSQKLEEAMGRIWHISLTHDLRLMPTTGRWHCIVAERLKK